MLTRDLQGRPAAFLDRDGVLNVDHGYVHRWSDFEWIAGATDALKALQARGFALVVVTNQSGLARGYYDAQAFNELCDRMRSDLASRGVALDAIYHCPHLPDATVEAYRMACDCRKPAAGMLQRAIRELGLDARRSFLVGDKSSDIDAACAAGLASAFWFAADEPMPADHASRWKGCHVERTSDWPAVLQAVDQAPFLNAATPGHPRKPSDPIRPD